MKTIITFLICSLVSSLLFADQLAVLNEKQAKETVAFIRKNPHVVLWCACCDGDMKQYVYVSKCDYQSGRIVEEMFEVVLYGHDKNGDTVASSIDLAYAHIIRDGKAFCIGTEMGYDCDPCTNPFKFDIPRVRPQNTDSKTGNIDFSGQVQRSFPDYEYNFYGISAQPDMKIKAIDGWAGTIAFDPDDRYIVAGGGYFKDKTALVLIDLATGEISHSFKGHETQVESVAIGPDGKYMVSSDQSGKVIIWDFKERKLKYEFKAHTDWVEGVAFSNNGRYAASASRDHYLKIWDVTSGKEVRSMRSSWEIVSSLSFSPDDRKLLVGGIGTTDETAIWDIEGSKELMSFDHFTRWTKAAVWSPDGASFASAGDCDNEARISDAATGNIVETIESVNGCVEDVAFDPKGRYLAIASMWGIQIWDNSQYANVFSAKTHGFPVEAILFSNTGKYLATAGRDGEVHVWILY